MSSPVHSQKANSITTMFYNIDPEVEEMIVSISNRHSDPRFTTDIKALN